MIRTPRSAVYDIIDGERHYQDTIRRKRENDPTPDGEKSIADFIIFIENKVNMAKESIYELSNDKALDNIRKIAALAVACMESHGAFSR